MPKFVPGLELNAAFYAQAVAPLVSRWRHSAARLGTGSEVLGFDDERSTDHGWGPKLLVLVDEPNLEAAQAVTDQNLPDTFGGWPVRYGWDEVPVTHHVEVSTLGTWLSSWLGVDATQRLTPTDWLLMPQQKLLEVTRGAVYHDDLALEAIRRRLARFPEPVWLWMLACQWRRVAQEEAFVGRATEVGDELGSRLIAGRLARELMRLWFLFNRTYWPYSKWFGSAFSRLSGSGRLGRTLEAALAAATYAEREEALATAYEAVACRHNELGLTSPVDASTRQFYSRPYRVLMADRFVDACLEALDEPDLEALPLVGSIDQVADSTDLLSDGRLPRRLRQLYEG